MNIKQTDLSKWILENGRTSENVLVIDEINKTIVFDADYTLTIAGAVSYVNLDLGSSGVAGSLDIFPTTASKGKLAFLAVANTGNTTTTITNAAFGQATVLTLPDPGGATASFVLTEGAQTLNGTKTIPELVTTNLDSGASGTAGTVDVFPTTAASGKLAITAADNAGDTTTTLVNASQAASRTYTIPDAGASASFAMTEGAQTLNGAKTIPAITATALTFAAGGTVNSDSDVVTLISHAGTLSKMAGVVTSEALTTAAGASQAFVITNTTVAAGDLVFVQSSGGTNTNLHVAFKAVTTANTITVTATNTAAVGALDGTLVFNFVVLKA